MRRDNERVLYVLEQYGQAAAIGLLRTLIRGGSKADVMRRAIDLKIREAKPSVRL